MTDPSPHHGSTSATQVSCEQSTAVSQAHKSSVTASLFEDKLKTGHMVSPLSQSRSFPNKEQLLGRQCENGTEQVYGGYGDGSVRRRDSTTEKLTKRRADEMELFKQYSQPPPRRYEKLREKRVLRPMTTLHSS